ncbi:MAG: cation:proton antiporter [Methanosarcinaceae archaeon]|nr:cation:proton antiporter [Methanosarcinaceae archaeon]
MENVFLFAGLVLIFASILSLYRVIYGPGIFNRIVAVNVIGTKTILILVLIGYIYGRPHFVDIALAYALLNVIMTIAATKGIEV